MEHLKAELEIRGYWDCANSLPKVKGKCKKVIEQIREECIKGECFVDPEKVLRDIASLRSDEGSTEWLKPLAITLTILIVIETFALTFLALDYMKYKISVSENMKKIKEEMLKLNKNLWLLKNSVMSTIARERAKFEKDLKVVKEIMWELKALELALSYLQR